MQAGTHPDEGGIRSGSGDPARVRDSAVTLHTQGSLPDARSTTNCCHRMKRRCQPAQLAKRGSPARTQGSLARQQGCLAQGSPALPPRQPCAPVTAALRAAQGCLPGSPARIRCALQAALRPLDFAVHPVLKVNAKRRVIKVIRVQRYKPSLVTMSW